MFRTSWIPLALVLLASSASGWAQEAAPLPRPAAPFRAAEGEIAASGVVAPTVEMWFYEQETRRRDDTKLAVRRRAEIRAQQRGARLASQKWYGISNSRPMVSPTPSTGSGYSAYWGSNTYEAYRWRAMAPATVVARPTEGPY